MIALDLAALALDPLRGVATALRHLLAGLVAVRPPGLVLLGLWPGPEPAEGSAAARALHGVERLVEPLAARRGLQGARRRLALRAQARGARALVCPWTSAPATTLPRVTWVHEAPFARQGALEGRLRALRHRLALARAVARSAALVVPSRAVLDDLLALHPEAAPRAAVVPHGFDPAPWRAAPDAPGAGGPYALAVGTGHGAGGARKKGLDVLAAAFRSGPVAGLRLVVVGAARGLPPGVEVVPEAGEARLRALVAGARVLVVASRSEGFGYPLLEACAAGVPVVAIAAGALPEVSAGAACLVPPGDPAALAAALALVAADGPLRAGLIAAGGERAGAFPVEAAGRAWLDLVGRVGRSA